MPIRPQASLSAKVLIAIAIGALAIGVRWRHISAEPLDFQPARQYHSAQIARAYYVEWSPGMPAWKTRIAHAYLREDGPIEAPILETIAASAYRVSYGERLWLPRLFSSLFWLAGALFLYLLATRFVLWWGAVFAALLYLFLPFPLVASTSFQPDPFMVMLLLAAALTIVRHDEQRTGRRFVAALVLTGAAIFAKPVVAAFFLLPLYAALAVARDGPRTAVKKPSGYAFAVLAVLPTVGFYVYSTITNTFVAAGVRDKLAPRLWGESFYWRGWRSMIEEVLRAPGFGARSALLILCFALLAIPLARSTRDRAVLVALWGGYLLFGLAYTNHISSHNYYSLPLIPIIALSAAIVVDAVAARARAILRGRRLVQVALAVAAALVAATAVTEKSAAIRFPRPDPGYAQRVPEWKAIGRLVHHTPNALTLEGVSGLKYDGWIGGRYWPNAGDLAWERNNDDLPPISADERFRTTDERYYPAVGAMRPRPDYFIVTEPMELARQPDLVVLLSDFRVVDQTPDYIIFDLRRRSSAHEIAARTTAASSPGVRPFYRFPLAWNSARRGDTRTAVLRALGRPHRIEVRHDLRKPVATWFYGSDNKHAVVFLGGRVFFAAMTY